MALTTTTLDYRDGETVCRGFYTRPADAAGPLPVLLLCPAWDGLVQEVHDKAEKFAAEGYLVVGVDVLGEGRTLRDMAELEPALTPFMQDRAMLLRRLQAAVSAAQALPAADPGRMAAVGYCFGGLCALDLARSGGEAIRAAVSFHGGLAPNGLGDQPIGAHVLVLHGRDDPLVPADQLAAFEQEMTERQADWQVVTYGHTAHAFTRPDANYPAGGILYNPVADRRSWQAATRFLGEVL